MPSIPQTSPADLRSLRGWLVWKFEPGAKGKKPRKVPYYANGYRRYADHGTPEDRSQLVPFDVALKIARQRGYDGVGLALLDGFNVTALDFDNCVDADGNVNPEVEKLVAGTYAELSPSGTGVRAFFHGELGNGKSHDGPYGFESFSTAGFVTYTGNTLDVCDLLDSGDTVAELPEDVRQLYQQRVGERRKHAADPLMTYEPTLGLSERQLLELLDGLDPDAGYEDWLRVGMALHHETGGERFDLWDEWSQGSDDKYPGTEALRKHWDSFDDTGTVVTARSLLKMSTAHVNPDLATADDFDVVSGEAGASPEKPPRFQVVPAADFSGAADKGWYVKGVLPRAELAVLYGESGSGKTFAVLDLAMAVARGVAWRGLRVKQGRVVYVAAEGGGGFRKRLKAYAQHQGIDLAEVPFGVIHAAPNMLAKTDALDVAKAIKAFGGADLVIVDTFAQVTPGGNENSGEDVGQALAHLKGIHRATGALVVLVHHSGKDASKGARGWSGLRAAVDAELEVFKLAGQRALRVSKQKDGDDTGEWGFDLEVVPIGMDEDGDVIDSCVVIEAAAPVVVKAGKETRAAGKWERLVMEVVGEMALGQSAGIEVEAVIAECLRKSEAPTDGKRDTRKQSAKRALQALCEGDEAPYFMEDGCLGVM